MTTISAIVPTYNRAGYLVEALNSILAQTRPVHEIIVWDDGSTDRTGEAVAGLGETPVPIRYFRAENGGKARALNCAMAETTGDTIWICDDDDLCRPDAAAAMVATMEKTGAPVVGGRYLRFGTDPESGAQVSADPGYWPDLSQGSLLRHLLEDIFIFQNATLARREAYARVGPFREDLARSIDYDMIVRLAARHPMAFVDEVLFDQRKHDGARGPAAALHAAREMDQVWRLADQAVFRAFYDDLPLSLYEAMFDGEAALVERAARLQRATVYARRDLWDVALEDLGAAAGLDAGPLSPIEAAICQRALAGKHESVEIFSPTITFQLTALHQAGPVGTTITAELAQGIRWRTRLAMQTRELRKAGRIAALVTRLAGIAGLRGAPPVTGPDTVAERQVLPQDAYAW